MSNRFEAIGSFVYENGNRIGVTPAEASVELARKLNAYQMRIERLKAEVEHLGAFRTNTIIPNEILEAENARLKAEVERLRKAGDAVSLCLEAFWKGKPYDTSTNIECFDAWNAAKEGKQS